MDRTRTQTTAGEFTRLLDQWSRGDAAALEKLVPAVYGELRRVAAGLLNREFGGRTLQSTALVHELYLRLTGEVALDVSNKAHFLSLAARLMRQILVDHARKRSRLKRGGGALRVPLTEHIEDPAGGSALGGVTLLELEEALAEFEKLDHRKARIVELRYFTGLSLEDIGQVLGISLATVKREWTVARLWLLDRLRGREESATGGRGLAGGG